MGIIEISQEVPILERADTGAGGWGGGAVPFLECILLHLFEFHDISLPLPTSGRTFRPVQWKNSATEKNKSMPFNNL